MLQNKKSGLLLIVFLSMLCMITSCDENKNPLAQVSAENNKTEFEICSVSPTGELRVKSSLDDLDEFKAEFAELTKIAQSDVTMTIQEIDEDLYTISFSGDLTDLAETNDVLHDQGMTSRGSKWYHFNVTNGNKVWCFSTKKRTKFGAGVWYAHMAPLKAATCPGSASGLKKGGC